MPPAQIRNTFDTMEFLKLTCIGLVMGMTLVIPGLSAGTMAIVFNVYDRLIGVIVPNVRKVLAAWQFWLPLVVGGIAGIFLFIEVISVLYEHHEIPTMMFFIGLIAGSLPLVYGRVRQEHSALPSMPSAICLVLALAVMMVIMIERTMSTHCGGTALSPELTPQVFGMLVLAGVLAAAALIIPGISGAFVLLVMGYYFTITRAVSDLNISLLLPVFLGAVVGLFLGASLVRFLLKKAPRATYGAVLGLVAGSIIVLLPDEGFGEGVTIVHSIICLLAGAAISLFFGRTQYVRK
jgi:putative membrane protein